MDEESVSWKKTRAGVTAAGLPREYGSRASVCAGAPWHGYRTSTARRSINRLFSERHGHTQRSLPGAPLHSTIKMKRAQRSPWEHKGRFDIALRVQWDCHNTLFPLRRQMSSCPTAAMTRLSASPNAALHIHASFN